VIPNIQDAPLLRLLVILAGIALFGAGQDFQWDLPHGFPEPVVPAENPMSAAKVELGRHLFYDKRLSLNQSQSCSTCHRQDRAFTDGLAVSVGSTGEKHPRASMTLANVAYVPALTWADPELDSLENQALVPMFGTEPVELGLAGQEVELLRRLRAEPVYQRLFGQAFPGGSAPYSVSNVTRALAAFQRSIISMRSPYDRYRYGDDEGAITDSAKRGEMLFFSGEKAGCFQCHGGWNFAGPVRYAGGPSVNQEFHNTGVHLQYRQPNTGLAMHSERPEDVGKFRAPTLRNIAVTAPYMHDGSIATLEEVIAHYAQGGRHPGSPNKSTTIQPLTLSAAERRDLLAFLHSLTDEELLQDARWSDPWKVK
jgi:cytochrome c peroxidase